MDSKRTKLRDECNNLFLECIWIRDRGICQLTGEPVPKWNGTWSKMEDRGDVVHLYSRGILAVRYLSFNSCLMKHGHHINEFHMKSPKSLHKWWKKKWPHRYNISTSMSKMIIKRTLPVYREIYENLMRYKKRLTGGGPCQELNLTSMSFHSPDI